MTEEILENYSIDEDCSLGDEENGNARSEERRVGKECM